MGAGEESSVRVRPGCHQGGVGRGGVGCGGGCEGGGMEYRVVHVRSGRGLWGIGVGPRAAMADREVGLGCGWMRRMRLMRWRGRRVVEIVIKIVASVRGYTQGAGRAENVLGEGGVEGKGDTLERAGGVAGSSPMVFVLVRALRGAWVGMPPVAPFHVSA